MIFSDGSPNSLKGISDTLLEFADLSRLRINPEKTELFAGGLNQLETNNLNRFGFQIGSLPIRYLGLPLMHRKLKLSEYAPLIEKVTKRFSSWTVRALTFAGRLQLISSVIFSLVNFWMTAFLLPKGCIKQLESLCSKFLWSGNLENAHCAKVSWQTVCLPKSEGGLGLKNFAAWNKTLCLRLIWLIFSKSGSLWVAWHKDRLSGISFWEVEEKSGDSWIWKSLLKLRHLAAQFIRCKLGNGLTASFWHDHWATQGPLINIFGPSGPTELGIPSRSTVASACTPLGWRLRPASFSNALELQMYLTTIEVPLNSSLDDEFYWVTSEKEFPSFNAQSTWNDLRPHDSTKDWATKIWFKGATPRHAFNMWIVHLDRLPTRQRLLSWGLSISPECCLCSAHEESRDHLLLRCEYSEALWRLVLVRLGMSFFTFATWSALIEWSSLSSTSSPALLRRLVSQNVVYLIWQERNNMLHNQIITTPEQLFRVLDRSIRDTILARRNRNAFHDLMPKWLSN